MLFQWESHGNGILIPMHTSNCEALLVYIAVRSASDKLTSVPWSLIKRSSGLCYWYVAILQRSLAFRSKTIQRRNIHNRRKILPRCRYAAVVLLWAVRLSVCLSVCQTRELWQNDKKFCPHFFTTWKIDHRGFPQEEWLVETYVHFYLKFWAKLTNPLRILRLPIVLHSRSISAVTPTGKSSIITNMKSTKSFPTSLWTAYVASEHPKWVQKCKGFYPSTPQSSRLRRAPTALDLGACGASSSPSPTGLCSSKLTLKKPYVAVRQRTAPYGVVQCM